jgi:hypothetical protein
MFKGVRAEITLVIKTNDVTNNKFIGELSSSRFSINKIDFKQIF